MSQNPRTSTYFHRAFQYRPTVTKDARGGNVNSAETRVKTTGEEHFNGFKCGIFQSPGVGRSQQAGGETKTLDFHLYCDPRDLRSEDIITSPQYPGLKFRIKTATTQGAIGEISAFTMATMTATVDQSTAPAA